MAGHSTLHPKERVEQMDRQPASVLKDLLTKKVQDFPCTGLASDYAKADCI